jgi:hypothetical protein
MSNTPEFNPQPGSGGRDVSRERVCFGMYFGGLMASCCAIPVPESGQRAGVGQRIGLTDITITYHPAAGWRGKIWGGVVPSGRFGGGE